MGGVRCANKGKSSSKEKRYSTVAQNRIRMTVNGIVRRKISGNWAWNVFAWRSVYPISEDTRIKFIFLFWFHKTHSFWFNKKSNTCAIPTLFIKEVPWRHVRNDNVLVFKLIPCLHFPVISYFILEISHRLHQSWLKILFFRRKRQTVLKSMIHNSINTINLSRITHAFLFYIPTRLVYPCPFTGTRTHDEQILYGLYSFLIKSEN